MVNRFITGIGAICSAAGLGFASFVIGHGIAGSGNIADMKNVGIGLLLSITVAVWGIFAVQIWGRIRGRSSGPGGGCGPTAHFFGGKTL